ncbi:MAG: dihydroxyacetone kinase subunit DhaL [Caldilineaceae bacterium]
MSQEITLNQFHQWLQRYADLIDEQESYLCDLDAAIGDGDHGANMVRGMTSVRTRLHEESGRDQELSTLLRNVAMALISSVGGAAGPLYGAFFLRAAKDLTEQDSKSVSLMELAHMFRSGLEGVQQRGKAVRDEKTMIDALAPAVEALEKAAQANSTIVDALQAASTAAEEGMHHTTSLQASKGRASYLGPRSIGHQDPGATSTYYLILAAAESFGKMGD